MERDPFMFEESGMRRIDMSPVEDMACSLAKVALHLNEDEFDVFDELYEHESEEVKDIMHDYFSKVLG